MNGFWNCLDSEKGQQFHQWLERLLKLGKISQCLRLETGNQVIGIQAAMASAWILMPSRKILVSTESEQ